MKLRLLFFFLGILGGIAECLNYEHNRTEYNIVLEGIVHKILIQSNNREVIHDHSRLHVYHDNENVSTSSIKKEIFKGIVTVDSLLFFGWARLVKSDLHQILHGVIHSPNGKTYHIHPKSSFQKKAKNPWHHYDTVLDFGKTIMVDTAKLYNKNETCGVTNYLQKFKRSSTIDSSCPSELLILRMGVVADCNYIRLYETIDAVVEQILLNINVANQVLTSQINIQLRLDKIIILPACNPKAQKFNIPCSQSYPVSQRLSDFSQYAGNRTNEIPYWHLMTECYSGGTVGVSWTGSICKLGSDTTTDPNYPGKLMTTACAGLTSVSIFESTIFTHETGHVLGANHDCDDVACSTCDSNSACPNCHVCEDKCSCSGRYIMNPSSSDLQTQFSKGSVSSICSVIHGSKSCLVPNSKLTNTGAFLKEVCGNGIKEGSEECDCGSPDSEDCKNDKCCIPNTCKLRLSAKCDDYNDLCCRSCKPIAAGSICRNSSEFCDEAEFCDGKSGSCPDDKHKPEKTECTLPDNTGGVCVKGECTSRKYQCMLRGSSMNIIDECVGFSDSCFMNCQSNTFKCIQIEAEFMEGSPCGYHGLGSCIKGSCYMSSSARIFTWIDTNIAAVLSISTALFVILAFVITRTVTWCMKRNKVKKERVDIKTEFPTYAFLNGSKESLPPNEARRQSWLQKYTGRQNNFNLERVALPDPLNLQPADTLKSQSSASKPTIREGLARRTSAIISPVAK